MQYATIEAEVSDAAPVLTYGYGWWLTGFDFEQQFANLAGR